jgi:hypothetical protein
MNRETIIPLPKGTKLSIPAIPRGSRNLNKFDRIHLVAAITKNLQKDHSFDDAISQRRKAIHAGNIMTRLHEALSATCTDYIAYPDRIVVTLHGSYTEAEVQKRVERIIEAVL